MSLLLNRKVSFLDSEVAFVMSLSPVNTISSLSASLSSTPVPFDAESLLDSLLLESTDCIAIKDWQGRYLWINPAGAAFLGQEIHDVIGKTDRELFTIKTAEQIMQTDQVVMQSGQTQTFEALLRPYNQEPRRFQAMKCPYKGSSGEVLGIINVVRCLY